MKKSSSKILLCASCEGHGVKDERVSAYESETVKCKICNGSGRVVEITTIEINPYSAKI